jgi:hypothetical protein
MKKLDISNRNLSELIEDLSGELEWYKKYADLLVDHINLPCLPADLRNLRESNEILDKENQELRKRLEQYE